MVWLFAGLIIAAIFGGLVLAVARFVGRLLLSASLATLAGLLAAIALGDDGGGATIGVLLALALIAPIFWFLTRRAGPQLRLTRSAEMTALEPQSAAGHRLIRRKRGNNAEFAWDRLLDAAPEHRSRIQLARRSCDRFGEHCAKRVLDLEAHRSKLIVGKHLTHLINEELDLAEETQEPRRSRRVDALIDLVERLAADCERQQAHNRNMEKEDELLLRRHIENYLSRDALTPLQP